MLPTSKVDAQRRYPGHIRGQYQIEPICRDGSERDAATAETTTFRLWVRQFPSTWDFYVLSVGGLGPLVEHGQKLVAFDVEVRQ